MENSCHFPVPEYDRWWDYLQHNYAELFSKPSLVCYFQWQVTDCVVRYNGIKLSNRHIS